MSKKICTLVGNFKNVRGNVIVADDPGGKQYLWGIDKGRRLYTFETQRNCGRVLSKDGVFVADFQPDRLLVILERTTGGNYKIILRIPNVTTFCIENDTNLLSYEVEQDFFIVKLPEAKTIYKHTARYVVYEPSWSIVSQSRKFLALHTYTESDLWIYRIENNETLSDRLSCDKVEFIGDSNTLLYMTRFGNLIRRNCENGEEVQLFKKNKNVTEFTQSPSAQFLAVKVGYYTNVNDEKYTQFFKDGQLWTRFDEIDEIDYFLNENTLAAIVVRYEETKKPDDIYKTSETGVLYETSDGWLTCKKIAHIDNCNAFFVNTDGNICAIIDKSTEWKNEIVVEIV